MTNREGPLLGLATTRELLDEIRVRGEREVKHKIEGRIMASYASHVLKTAHEELLEYRTVDS